MSNAMDRIGKLRSFLALGSGLAVDALLLDARGEEQWGDLVRYARDRDPMALSPDRLAPYARWSVRFPASTNTNPLRIDGRHDWRLTIHTVEIASRDTFDLGRAQVTWATTPARELLEWWEAWARASRDVDEWAITFPCAALDAKDAWSRDPSTVNQRSVTQWDTLVYGIEADVEERFGRWSLQARFMHCIRAALRMTPAPHMSTSSEFAASVVRLRDFGGDRCEGSRADERQRLRAFNAYALAELGLTSEIDGARGLNLSTP